VNRGRRRTGGRHPHYGFRRRLNETFVSGELILRLRPTNHLAEEDPMRQAAE
jgi:hypothetical protein